MVACAARELKKAEEFAKKFDIPNAHGSYEALAKDPDAEVVYIGTINPTHLPLAKLYLDHGKHVLCEKPLAMNVKQVDEMLEYAMTKNLFLMEAMWSRLMHPSPSKSNLFPWCQSYLRFQPAHIKLKEEIEKGTLGDIYQVNHFKRTLQEHQITLLLHRSWLNLASILRTTSGCGGNMEVVRQLMLESIVSTWHSGCLTANLKKL